MPKPKNSGSFKHLALTYAGLEAALSARPAKGQVGGEKARKAWEMMISPERMVVLAANQDGHFMLDGSQHNARPNFAGYTKADCELLTEALAEVRAKVERIAGSPELAKLGAAHAGLLVSASGEQAEDLAYPLLGLALRPAKTTLEGKRVATVSGYWLTQADDLHAPKTVDGAPNYENHRVPVVPPARWLGEDFPAAEREAAQAEIQRARSLLPNKDEERSEDRLKWMRFASTLHARKGAADLSSDAPLPSVRLLQATLAGGQKTQGTEVGVGGGVARAVLSSSKARAALARLRSEHGAFALSALLDDSGVKASGPMHWARVNDLDAGPLSTQVIDFAPSPRGTLLGALGSLGLDPNTGYGSYGYWEKGFIEALGTPDFDEFMRKQWKKSEAAARARPGNKEGRGGASCEELARELAQKSPALALLQWSRLMRQDGYYEQRLADAFAQIKSPTPEDLTREALRQELKRLSEAVIRAGLSFTQGALDAAKSIEAGWVAQKGLSGAWEQAGQGGEISSRSMAWALANPVSGALASANPMARLAARCSQPLGLRQAKDETGEEALLLARFETALAERGVGERGLSALVASAPLRELLADWFARSIGAQKPEAAKAKARLSFLLPLIESAAQSGMPGDEIAMMGSAYLDPAQFRKSDKSSHDRAFWELDNFDRFGAAFKGAHIAWDGFTPGFGKVSLLHEKQAQQMLTQCEGKERGYPLFIASLVADWSQAREVSTALGQSEEVSLGIARERVKELLCRFPIGNQDRALDWSQPLFESHPAWQVLGGVSPRLSAAQADAKERGGPIGSWCANFARALGVDDARDGNELIAKARDAVKARAGLSDGAWRLAIKSPNSLAFLARTLSLKPEADISYESGQSLLPGALMDPQALQALRIAPDTSASTFQEPAREMGRALSLGAATGLAPVMAERLGEHLVGHERGSWLFGSVIGEVEASGADGARFFLAESAAKREREGAIIKEFSKRFERHEAQAAKPLAEGELSRSAAQRMNDEIQELADWIKGTERGLWQQQAAAPTWGQLLRQSEQWHQEQAAMARDEQARKEAREARLVEQGVNIYKSGAGAAWPKVLGRFAQGGWEAIELQTAADLTQEGAAMSHCVSSYSPQCRRGEARIFSIRLNGERVSTLELTGISPGGEAKSLGDLDETARFTITQNKKKHNHAVTSIAALEFCELTRASAQQAWAEACIKRRLALAEKQRQEREQAKAAKAGVALGGEEGSEAPDQLVDAGAAPKRQSRARAGGV